jgi:hypothetical protein
MSDENTDLTAIEIVLTKTDIDQELGYRFVTELLALSDKYKTVIDSIIFHEGDK